MMVTGDAAWTLAAEAAPGAEPEPEFPASGTVIFTVGFFLIFWFLLLRPQLRRDRDEKDIQQRVKKNDHVITKCGMHGVVMNVKDDEVVLRIDEQQNVKVRFQRNAIATVVGDRDDEARSKDAPKEPKKD